MMPKALDITLHVLTAIMLMLVAGIACQAIGSFYAHLDATNEATTTR